MVSQVADPQAGSGTSDKDLHTMATVLTEVNLPGADSGIDWVNPFIQFMGELTAEMPGMTTTLPMIAAALLVGVICYIFASKIFSSLKRIGFKGFAAGTTLSALVGFPMQVGTVLLGLLQTVLNVVIMFVLALFSSFGG